MGYKRFGVQILDWFEIHVFVNWRNFDDDGIFAQDVFSRKIVKLTRTNPIEMGKSSIALYKP